MGETQIKEGLRYWIYVGETWEYVMFSKVRIGQYDILDAETGEIRWTDISATTLRNYISRGKLCEDDSPDDECIVLDVSMLFE